MKRFFWFLTLSAAALTFTACPLENICDSNETKCDGQLLLTCSLDGNWSTALICESYQFCNDKKGCVECRDDKDCEAKDSKTPICNVKTKTCQAIEAVCGRGETQCEGKVFQICNSVQSGFNDTTCDGYCDPAKGCVECGDNNDCKNATKPVCNDTTKVCQSKEAVCSQGETKCDGNSFKVCNALGNGFNETVCGGTTSYCDVIKGCVGCLNSIDCTDGAKPFCNVETNSCVADAIVCAKGQKTCVGNTMKACNALGSGFDETVCGGATPYCDGIKGCVECRNGEDCTEPGKLICNTEKNTCGADAFVCEKGEKLCEDNIYRKCNEARTAYDEINCGFGNYSTKPICHMAQTCVECKSNLHCTKDAAKSICMENVCVEPVCLKNEALCVGDTYKKCNAYQTGFDSLNCGGIFPYCEASVGCIQCRSNADCLVKDKPICHPDAKLCMTAICQIGEVECVPILTSFIHKKCNDSQTGYTLIPCGTGPNADKSNCDLALGCVK